MQMRFGPDDEEAFFAARDGLLERFGAWVEADRPMVVDPDDARLLLDWKWGYGDGDLGHWQRFDVDEFLLEHCPRKVSGPPDALATIPASVAAFTRFLDAAGLLAPGSDTAGELADRALAQTRAFEDAMHDDSRFGMAKSLFSRMGLDVDDLPDADELAAAMERFNALSFEERGAILGDVPFGPPFGPDDEDEELDGPPLPYRSPPSEADVAAAAAAAPVLATLDRLHDQLGAKGVKLTKTGNVTLADARVLVDVLDTGDTVDPEVDGVVYKTTTAADLAGLDAVLALAKECRTVRKHGGRLLAVAAWTGLEATARCDRVLAALDEIGMHGVWHPYAFPAFRDLDEVLDSVWPHLVAGSWMVEEAVDVEPLVDGLVELCTEMQAFPAWETDGERRRRTVANGVDDVLRSLELAGLIRRDGATVEGSGLLGRKRGGTVELTPLADTLAVTYLRRAGYGVTVVAELVELDADALLDALGTTEGGLDDIAAAWFAAREEAKAVEALVAAIEAADDPLVAATGLHLLETKASAAEPAVRRLLEGPLQSHAWLWLAATGFEDLASIDPRHAVTAGIDGWLGILRFGEPADVIESMLGLGPAAELRTVLDAVAASDHPRAGELLELVGRHHPDKPTAKHARKAAHRWRSRARS